MHPAVDRPPYHTVTASGLGGGAWGGKMLYLPPQSLHRAAYPGSHSTAARERRHTDSETAASNLPLPGSQLQ